MEYQDNADETPTSSVPEDEKDGNVTEDERLESTNTLMKNSSRKQSILSILEKDWETCSDECDCSSGYEPDSESDVVKYSRWGVFMKSNFLSSDIPQKRKREEALKDDVEDASSNDDIDSLSLASIFINGRKSKAKRLEFIPDISSVNIQDMWWEPHENLNGANGEIKKGTTFDPECKTTKTEDKPKGFSSGLTAEKIIGTTNEDGELFFLIKWKESDDADLVAANEANIKIPQVVIKFYEDRFNKGANIAVWLEEAGGLKSDLEKVGKMVNFAVL